MKRHTTRAGWMIVIPALALAVWLAALGVVAWQSLGQTRSRLGQRLIGLLTARGREPDTPRTPDTGPAQMSDPRLDSLRQAVQSWKRSTNSKRAVIDQVCLVPDATAFFEAIAAWDERHFFPILIDDPAWTLPFLRAFRPAAVVRYVGRPGPKTRRPEPAAVEARGDQHAVWSEALRAVSASWSGPSESEGVFPDAGLPPRELGLTPPGIVLSAPEAPMLAGAVALAAGRFQPLVCLRTSDELRAGGGDSVSSRQFGDVLSLQQAWSFAVRVEKCVAAVIPAYHRLGDDCDFLTIAAHWPYRYSCDLGDPQIRGVYALDDLIGRGLDASIHGNWSEQTRRRWAYTGRLVGDPAASVAHAMGALFLQPTSTLLWNTYSGGEQWSDYAMGSAARELARIGSGKAVVAQRTGFQADLASWHRTVDPVNPFGMILMNTSGGPDWFRISGGVGRPSDIPRGIPTAVAMIHSFSAADPTDPQTIAGRWLDQGAFGYFGAVNEPFLVAFRTPRLVAELMAAGVPFVAALRRGEAETFGIPWRLCYLGDPLYHLQSVDPSPDRHGGNLGAERANSGRIHPSDWRQTTPAYARWPVTEIAPPVTSSKSSGPVPEFKSEEKKFRWCLDASIGELAGLASPRVSPGQSRDGRLGGPPGAHAGGWPRVLLEIRRDQLQLKLRPFFDDLLIDVFEEAGAFEELALRLAQIPQAEREPRVWQALERSGMARLARLWETGGTLAAFVKALDLWDGVMGLSWPQASQFPAHFTERVAALSSFDAYRRGLWLLRLRRARDVMAADPGRNRQAAVVAAELKRLEAFAGSPAARG